MRPVQVQCKCSRISVRYCDPLARFGNRGKFHLSQEPPPHKLHIKTAKATYLLAIVKQLWLGKFWSGSIICETTYLIDPYPLYSL